MTRFARDLRQSSFLRHNTVFFFGSLAMGILNYAFYPIVGRLLPLPVYGEVQTLISLFTQLSIFMSVLGLVAVNIISNYNAANQKQMVTLELEKLGLLFSVIVLVLGSIFGNEIEHFFRFNSIWPLRIMLLAFVVSVPFVFRQTYLRANKKFGQLSIVAILNAGSEIVFAVLLIKLGYGATGALFALILCQLLAYSYAVIKAKEVGFERPPGHRYFDLPAWNIVRPELKYSAFVLFLSIVITILSTVDLLVVKHYFSQSTAGTYAGVSIIGRSIYFLTVPISAVLLPLVRMNQKRSLNESLLLKSFGLLLLTGGSALIFFSLFPRFVIRLLMGAKYLPFAHLLPELSLAMFLFSVLNLLLVYCIALREYQATVVVAISGVVAVIAIFSYHSSVETVVTDLVVSGGASLVLFGSWFALYRIRGKIRYAE